MPIRPLEGADVEHFTYRLESSRSRPAAASVEQSGADWREHVPTLRGGSVILREVVLSDAPALFASLTSHEVTRFLHEPPGSVDAFERFISRSQAQRAEGSAVCFAVTLSGFDAPIGIVQIRAIDADRSTAEWGFALA